MFAGSRRCGSGTRRYLQPQDGVVVVVVEMEAGFGEGRGQRQASGRQTGDKLAQFDKIFPIMEEKKKAATWQKAQMCSQNHSGT